MWHYILLPLFYYCRNILADEIFAPREFDNSIVSSFVADVTSKSNLEEFHYSMFRALTFLPSENVEQLRSSSGKVDYSKMNFISVERINIGTPDTPGLSLTTGAYTQWNGSEVTRMHGIEKFSEDPRIATVGDRAIISFTVRTGATRKERNGFFQRWTAVSNFTHLSRVILKLSGLATAQNFIEKNWAPFSKNDQLLFVYSFDPLVILSCSTEDPQCKIIFIEDGATLPIDTYTSHLRGGSNLVPVSDSDDRYYIGGCHTNFQYKHTMFHFYVVIVLDTVEWKIIHVSKPVRFKYDDQLVGWGSHIQLGRVGNTLMDFYTLKVKSFIQDPVSFMRVANNTFLTTINVRDCVSLLYELQIPVDDIIRENGKEPRKHLGYWNNRASEMTDWLGDHVEEALRKNHLRIGIRGSQTADGRPIPTWRDSNC